MGQTLGLRLRGGIDIQNSLCKKKKNRHSWGWMPGSLCWTASWKAIHEWCRSAYFYTDMGDRSLFLFFSLWSSSFLAWFFKTISIFAHLHPMSWHCTGQLAQSQCIDNAKALFPLVATYNNVLQGRVCWKKVWNTVFFIQHSVVQHNPLHQPVLWPTELKF